MKKIICLLCAFTILSLCGCGSNNTVSENNKKEETIVLEESEIQTSNNEESEIQTSNNEESEIQTSNNEELSSKSKEDEQILENAIKLEDNNLKFELNWNTNRLLDYDYDLDLVAFMLNSDNINYENKGFVFYNNKNSFDNSIVLSDDIRESDTNFSEALTIDLNLVDELTVRIPIMVCRFYKDNFDLSELGSADLIVKNGQTIIKSFSVVAEGVSFEVCDLLRTDDGWYLIDKEINSKEDLSYFARNYGLNVEK